MNPSTFMAKTTGKRSLLAIALACAAVFITSFAMQVVPHARAQSAACSLAGKNDDILHLEFPKAKHLIPTTSFRLRIL
jgi:hypothetical protein